MTPSRPGDAAVAPVSALPTAYWSAEVARALTGDGVEIHYQPIIDLKRAVVVGHEALLRFPGHPVGSPATWLEAAHGLGRGAELEALALRLAFEDRPHLPDGGFLAVNVLPGVLDHPAVREVLDGQGSLAGVVVELTEHTRVECYEALQPHLARLRAAGAVVAVDDTGAGYAGLQHLIGIRPDVIKLDRALIAGIDRDRTRRMLLGMISTFATRFDAWTLAEGVETSDELATLVRLGVPLAQGYHLARPARDWQTLDDSVAAEVRGCHRPPTGPRLRMLLEPVPVGSPASRLSAPPRETMLPVHVDADIAETLIRAMARPVEDRFEPLLCTDDDGRPVGMVRIERAVEFLAADAVPAGD